MKKLLMCSTVLIASLLSVCFYVSQAEAYITINSRESNYIINADGSFTYSIDELVKNNDYFNYDTYLENWNILAQGVTVTHTGFGSFVFNSPQILSHTFNFLNNDPLGSSSVTKTLNIDTYNTVTSLAPGEERHLTLSYSAPAGVWADKSSNVNFPWLNTYGYWEFVGDGYSSYSVPTFTVNLTLPSTLDTTSVKLLGYDVVPTQTAFNQFRFVGYNVSEVNEDVVFKTTEPLVITPEPMSLVLFGIGGAALGLGRLRKRINL